MQYITPHHVSSCDLFICKADQEREERELPSIGSLSTLSAIFLGTLIGSQMRIGAVGS